MNDLRSFVMEYHTINNVWYFKKPSLDVLTLAEGQVSSENPLIILSISYSILS